MLKAVLHALASSDSQDTPFLVVLIPLVWEDTPWNLAAIHGQHNMATLIWIPAGHMRFVPFLKQSDEATPVLSPAKWPVEFVLIANSKGRETFLSHDRITRILCPAIQATCHLTQEQIRFFPTPPAARGSFGGRLSPPPRRFLPAQPATPAQTPTRSSAPHRLDNHPDTFHPYLLKGSQGIRTSPTQRQRQCFWLLPYRDELPERWRRLHLLPTASKYGKHTSLPFPT
jgi:hypothetical protein